MHDAPFGGRRAILLLMFLEPLIFGGFGLIVGSFLNVLVLREGTGRTIQGRSACMSCGHTLSWLDLIPVVSWAALRGRCRFCGSRVSVQYPLVELTTAVLFAAIGAFPLISIAFKVLFCVSVALLVAIAAYDILHTIIPDMWVYSFDALAIISTLLLLSHDSYDPVWLILLSGPIVALPLYTLWFVSGGKWMGLGDAKLALGIGWLLGPVNGSIAIAGSFVIGAVISVFILIPISNAGLIKSYLGITSLKSVDRRLTMTSEVPFGPFLIASCIIIWFLNAYGFSIPLFG